MCGIAGVAVRRGNIDTQALNKMQAALRHRGPDGEGRFLNDSIGLAHTRLSIIDLAGGAQPLYGRNDRNVLIANGEIYNEPEMRGPIEANGYPFRTHSDCEIILPLYEKYGADCVSHLRGMFAFALYDHQKRELLLGRDRMGEKPLYVYQDDEKFVFSSELRSLLASGLVSTELDPAEIARYFRYQYVPEPGTPFKNIRKVEAGSTLTLSLDTWKTKKTKYWNLLDAPPIDGAPERIIQDSLVDAVENVLRSDVPVGLSLSGGVDSSAIACIASKVYPGKLSAISVGYPNSKNVDERDQARELANQLQIDFIDVEVSDDEFIDNFPRMILERDDPIGDISGYSYYRVMETAHEIGVPVMLQGHGLDELCWGYPWVKDAVEHNVKKHAKALEKLQRRNADKPWFSSVGSFLNKIGFSNHPPTLMKEIEFWELTPYTRYAIDDRSSLFHPSFIEKSGMDHFSSQTEYGESSGRYDLDITRLICDYYLIENGIAQGDRLSMAHSIEARLPFVDHKLVETFIGLRKANPDHQHPPKYWLKKALNGIVDENILTRPKRGFSPPASRWQKDLRSHYGHLLRDGYLADNKILSSHAINLFSSDGLNDNAQVILSRLAVSLEIWLRGVVEGQSLDDLAPRH